MSGDLLEPQVRRLFACLQHAGSRADTAPGNELPDVRTVDGEAGREQRGTCVRFTLRLRGPEVLEARYQAYGCPHTLAVCEWLAERLEADGWASLGNAADWCRTLGIPIVKLGRLLIVEDALLAALQKAAPPSAMAGENVVK
jgi:hypothetical protein